MSVAVRIVLLTVLWLLAWGEASVANVVSGVLVSGVLLFAFPAAAAAASRRPAVRVAPFGLVRLAGYVVAQLVTSNVAMTREIAGRRRDRRPGVVAFELDEPSEQVVTVMTSIISLSPGTMAVDVTADAAVVHVHFFDLVDVDEGRRSLERLERLVVAAFPRRRRQAGATEGSESR
jgi:multicomponent Na+:H+ antiporter subunit E